MNDENLKNQNNAFHDANVLEDYEIEIVKKIGFWATLLYKFKNKNVKLLPSGNTKPQKTYKSIFYMWNLGSFKISLFNTLDNFKSSISKHEITDNKNYINLQIIGKEDNYKQNIESNTSVIIPKPINSAKHN